MHPLHLADLQRSGLTDETIQAAGIYTVPIEIDKKLGGLANGVVSALAFQYPGCDGFERYKVWRGENADPRAAKYLQKTGTPNHLYLLPGVDLAGDSPLINCEGEKKTLALHQAGFQAVGLPGIWGFCEKGEGYRRPKETRPIADLDLVNWRRPVTILFDSDGHDNRNVRLAAFRLGREVARRGGQVSILFLPAGEKGEKVGADDFLVAHGPEALVSLLKTAWPFNPTQDDQKTEIAWQTRELTPKSPKSDKFKALSNLVPVLARMKNLEVAALLEELRERLKLRAGDLAGLKADVRAARKALEGRKRKGQGKTLEVKDLEENFRLHPAIDFLQEGMTIGFRVSLADNATGLLLVFSDGRGVRADVNPEAIEIGERVYQVIENTAPPFLQDVWGLDRLKAFLEHPTRPQNLYELLVAAFKQYLDCPEPVYRLLAAWAVGTYFAHLFTAFPFLHFFGPKESGKSKTLEALGCVCFNAWKGRDITAAALGDTVDGQRGTVLIDQAEKLSNDKENGNLIGLLADSYKKAGGQRRVIDTSGKSRKVLEFSTYGPKSFASTKHLDPDLEDRCVRIPMTRTRKRLPDLEGWEPVWGELRDKMYRFTLAAFKEVVAHYQAIPGDGTRIGELWRPMLAVLLALEVEHVEIEAVRTLFMEGAEETRHELDPWESILFEVLNDRAESEPGNFEMTAEEVLTAMDIEGEHKPGTKWVGNALSRFSLYSKHLSRRYADESRKHKVQPYLFIPGHVLKMYEIYLRDTPQNEASQASQADNINDADNLHGTKANPGTCPKASQEGEEGELGRSGTCPEKARRPTELMEFVDDSYLGRMGRDKSGGIPEKNIDLFKVEL